MDDDIEFDDRLDLTVFDDLGRGSVNHHVLTQLDSFDQQVQEIVDYYAVEDPFNPRYSYEELSTKSESYISRLHTRICQ
ncbi:MAG: hypothetical protein CMN60_20655 [Sphingobium sp.]|nr:hypothetical protein [Sphingobium sp.]MBS50058.1 hypothetical protein [Sphingobium sp.]